MHKVIDVEEEYLQVGAGQDISVGYNLSERYLHSMWVDKGNDLFYERNITIYQEKIFENNNKY